MLGPFELDAVGVDDVGVGDADVEVGAAEVVVVPGADVAGPGADVVDGVWAGEGNVVDGADELAGAGADEDDGPESQAASARRASPAATLC
jgi:hypothetical protein